MRRSVPILAMAILTLFLAGPSGCSKNPSGGSGLPATLAQHQELAQEVISGDRARGMVGVMDPTWRMPGNVGFNDALLEVVKALEATGYVEEGPGVTASLTYRFEHLELSRPTWDPVQASLRIVGQDAPLMTLASNINLVGAYSFSTLAGGIEAELVDVGRGSAEDFEGKDVRGKVVLADGSVSGLFRQAVQEHGALGVMAYSLSSYNRPEVNRHIARMSSIPYDPDAETWGLVLSMNARDALREALAQGPVQVHVEVESRIYPSEELTLVADVRGAEYPDERFVYSAHVQESGANDNATGVAALAEVARVFGEGVTTGAFNPARTISMIWGDEISSTGRYLEDDPARTEGVLWGMSLDMVGEDTEKTGGTFLIEKMPDPSAVWTRGEDEHTEWGGRPMTVDQMTPHYFNDFVLNRCLDQAAETGWVVKTNPYEGGSDHVPFLRANAPGLLLWHFTDQFYHTDGDRLEMVSATTLENVSVCAATSAMALTTANAETAIFLIGELEEAALERLRKEAVLSGAALAEGAELSEERLILETWTDWYLSAIDAMTDIEVGGSSETVTARIQAAKTAVEEFSGEAVTGLGG